VTTKQPETKCDDQLFTQGETVAIITDLASTAVEAQVVRWREEHKRPLDWHYTGGGACVRCFPADVDFWRGVIAGWRPRVYMPSTAATSLRPT